MKPEQWRQHSHVVPAWDGTPVRSDRLAGLMIGNQAPPNTIPIGLPAAPLLRGCGRSPARGPCSHGHVTDRVPGLPCSLYPASPPRSISGTGAYIYASSKAQNVLPQQCTGLESHLFHLIDIGSIGSGIRSRTIAGPAAAPKIGKLRNFRYRLGASRARCTSGILYLRKN
jgi:hypothetical protein